MDEFLDNLVKIAGVLDSMFLIAYTIKSIIDYFRGGRKNG